MTDKMEMPKSDGRCSRETLIQNIRWIEDLNRQLNIENVVLRKERDELAAEALSVIDQALHFPSVKDGTNCITLDAYYALDKLRDKLRAKKARNEMEMTDVIYVDQGLVYGEEIYPTDSEKYHHSRIVESLKAENEELKGDKQRIKEQFQETDVLYWQQVKEIEELKAKLDKANDALEAVNEKSLYVPAIVQESLLEIRGKKL